MLRGKGGVAGLSNWNQTAGRKPNLPSQFRQLLPQGKQVWLRLDNSPGAQSAMSDLMTQSFTTLLHGHHLHSITNGLKPPWTQEPGQSSN
jgi:hypothetical protein